MNYEDTLNFLYSQTPAFHQVGAKAYKPGLETTLSLDRAMGTPHKQFQSIHVAGTNGKGSVSHLLAAILAESGYRVGLYTSPHLVDFGERIRVNGKKIPQTYVVEFVERYTPLIRSLKPSFFEMTSAMAFDFFRHEKVDIAIIETGLGGRLDSTNIISPILSIITNISKDHTEYLGDTLEQIAYEKAGIIKEGIPVVIGEADDQRVRHCFEEQAARMHAPIHFAEEEHELLSSMKQRDEHWIFQTASYGEVHGALTGAVQEKNARTVLSALSVLQQHAISIPAVAVQKGFEQVVMLTGLQGRWQRLQVAPEVICDTGHNSGAWESISKQLEEAIRQYKNLRIVLGMMGDKDLQAVLKLLPKQAIYYFTQAATIRAIPAETLSDEARREGIESTHYAKVTEAIEAALHEADPQDLLFIGGSTFVVAEAIPYIQDKEK